MNPEPLAAIANAVETRLNVGYNYWGFEAPESLYDELRDCQTIGLYHAEPIYQKLYALNILAYNGRYSSHEETADEIAPIIDGSKYGIHQPPQYREQGCAGCPWQSPVAKLRGGWLYQTNEDTTRNDPLRLAMKEFRDGLYDFIVLNSPDYIAVRWGEFPQSHADDIREESEPDAELQSCQNRNALKKAGRGFFRLLQKGHKALRRW